MYQPKKLIQANDARIGGTFVPFTKFVFFVCCFLMGFLPLRSMAQDPMEVDLANIANTYNVSGGTLNANQAGTFSFELGSVASPAADVLGLELDITLSDQAVLPTSSLALNFEGSWLLEDVEVSQSITVNGSTRILHIGLILSDNVPETGHGFVLSFPIVSAYNNVAASSLVTELDGIVIIENIDLRLEAPAVQEQQFAETVQPVCYPNPNLGTLYVPFEDADRLRVTGLDGRCREFALTDASGIGLADIVALQEGLFWIEVFRGNELISNHWIKRN